MTFDNFNNTRYLRRFVLGCSFRLAGKVDAQIYMQSKVDDIKSNSLKECFVFFFLQWLIQVAKQTEQELQHTEHLAQEI